MATLFGAKYVEVPDPGFIHDLDAMADAITENTRLVFIANPNNPTGTMVDQEAIDRFMDRLPEHVIAVFDEAYYRVSRLSAGHAAVCPRRPQRLRAAHVFQDPRAGRAARRLRHRPGAPRGACCKRPGSRST